jgi:hypothetical protein
MEHSIQPPLDEEEHAMSGPSKPTDQIPRHDGQPGHRLMMIICCIPILVLAIVLAATGVLGAGLAFTALVCVAMMGAMMVMMSGGGQK